MRAAPGDCRTGAPAGSTRRRTRSLRPAAPRGASSRFAGRPEAGPSPGASREDRKRRGGASVGRDRETVAQKPGVHEPYGPPEARLVGTGDHPRRLLLLEARRGDYPRVGPERADDPLLLVEQVQLRRAVRAASAEPREH